MGISQYIKSSIKLTDGGSIYFPLRIKKLEEDIYENFMDSYGNTHSVKVAVKQTEYIFKDEDISIEYYNEHLYIRHKLTCMPNRCLQFNLDKYYIFDNHWESDYMFLKGFFDYNEEPYYFDNLNRYMNIFKESGYFPIFEHCNSHNTNCIINYIPDRIFFNYPNRIHALERISEWSREMIFLNVDYINMPEIELVKFIMNRLKNKIEFENQIKKLRL